MKAGLDLLVEYLRRNLQGQSLLNRAVSLRAVPGILQPVDRSAIVNELFAKATDRRRLVYRVHRNRDLEASRLYAF